jgi:hypothetical protein
VSTTSSSPPRADSGSEASPGAAWLDWAIDTGGVEAALQLDATLAD